LGLPPGNLWEPPIAKQIAREVTRRGNTPAARIHVAGLFRMQLGLS
jgi:hypothetical protein